MINNIDIIKSLLNFSDKGDFYMLYVLKRKKDQPEGEKDNHQSVRTIKTYCIESIEYLEKRYDEIKMLCEVFKARAYIHVQKQNHSEVSLNMMVELAQRIKNGTLNQRGLFESVVGQLKTIEKRWIIDVDTKDNNLVKSISNEISEIAPLGDKILAKVPTKDGYHLITTKFDLMKFNQKFPEVVVVKKNPTLVYYPNSLN